MQDSCFQLVGVQGIVIVAIPEQQQKRAGPYQDESSVSSFAVIFDATPSPRNHAQKEDLASKFGVSPSMAGCAAFRAEVDGLKGRPAGEDRGSMCCMSARRRKRPLLEGYPAAWVQQ